MSANKPQDNYHQACTCVNYPDHSYKDPHCPVHGEPPKTVLTTFNGYVPDTSDQTNTEPSRELAEDTRNIMPDNFGNPIQYGIRGGSVQPTKGTSDTWLDEVLQNAHPDHLLGDPKCEACHHLMNLKATITDKLAQYYENGYWKGRLDEKEGRQAKRKEGRGDA